MNYYHYLQYKSAKLKLKSNERQCNLWYLYEQGKDLKASFTHCSLLLLGVGWILIFLCRGDLCPT